MTHKPYAFLRLVGPVAALVLASFAPTAARADFFDGMRQTFTQDVPHFFTNDVPHFFQDDIPCAFGGQPTSHTGATCRSSSPAVAPAADHGPTGTAVPPPAPLPNGAGGVPPPATPSR
jgi:hypothetical protein